MDVLIADCVTVASTEIELTIRQRRWDKVFLLHVGENCPPLLFAPSTLSNMPELRTIPCKTINDRFVFAAGFLAGAKILGGSLWFITNTRSRKRLDTFTQSLDTIVQIVHTAEEVAACESDDTSMSCSTDDDVTPPANMLIKSAMELIGTPAGQALLAHMTSSTSSSS